VAHPGAVKIAGGADPITAAAAAFDPRYRVLTHLPPRESATYRVTGPARLSTSFDGVAQSSATLLWALGAMFAVFTRGGSTPALAAVGEMFSIGKCAAAAVAEAAVGTLLRECLTSDMLADLFGVWGALAGVLMATAAVLELLRSQVNALGDQMNGRDRYNLAILPGPAGGPDLDDVAAAQATIDAFLRAARASDRAAMRRLSAPSAYAEFTRREAGTGWSHTGRCRVAGRPPSCETVVLVGPPVPGVQGQGLIFVFGFGRDAGGRMLISTARFGGSAG
jgi:hypothetical protein